jgi:arylsulfatase A-like enzyme
MTGRYPARVGLTGIVANPNEGLALDEITIAERLKSTGYATAHLGKWHLGGPRMYPERQGFDVNVGGTHIGMPAAFFYPAWKGKEHEYGPIGGVPLEGTPGDYLPDRLTDEALDFIRTHKNQPFFLHMAYYAVHIPYEAPEKTIERYRARIKPDDPQNNAVYGAMVDSVDRNVGRILHTLDELGCADNTIVVFFSDNGGLAQADDRWPPATSNKPLRAGKGWLYEGGIREPLLVRWPGVVQPGSTCDVPVCSIDFFPTLCEATGVKPSGTRPLDGVSLMPLLTRSGAIDRDALYWHFPVGDIGPPAGAVRHGDDKLIEFFDDGRLELYNLDEDVGETHDLAAAMPERTAALHKLLVDWRRSVGVVEGERMRRRDGFPPGSLGSVSEKGE